MAIISKSHSSMIGVTSAEINNGGLTVGGPKGDPTSTYNSNYTRGNDNGILNKYASNRPTIANVNARYNTAFTGCPPCIS